MITLPYAPLPYLPLHEYGTDSRYVKQCKNGKRPYREFLRAVKEIQLPRNKTNRGQRARSGRNTRNDRTRNTGQVYLSSSMVRVRRIQDVAKRKGSRNSGRPLATVEYTATRIGVYLLDTPGRSKLGIRSMVIAVVESTICAVDSDTIRRVCKRVPRPSRKNKTGRNKRR
jgi:hypothetical protein